MSAVNVAGSVCEDFVYDPWSAILPEGYAAVVSDLKRAYDVVVVRRKDARDTSERWFGMVIVESSVVGVSSGQQAVRISNFVEVGEVDYLSQSVSTSAQYEFRCQKPWKGETEEERDARQSCNQVLSLMMSWWCCPRDGEFTLMTPILQLAWEMKIKLFLRAVVVVVVALRQSFSRAPDNWRIFLFAILI